MYETSLGSADLFVVNGYKQVKYILAGTKASRNYAEGTYRDLHVA